MKNSTRLISILVFLSIAFSSLNLYAGHPTQPIESLTPGDLCDHADEIRYPEKIKYCRRNVETHTKWQVINEYDKHGFDIGERRAQFKIDHFIPLCMGGSNRVENLWPQHQSVYQRTDPLEHTLCEKLAAGRILQSEAIDRIKHAKRHLEEVERHLQEVNAL